MFKTSVSVYFLLSCNIFLISRGLEKISTLQDDIILLTESIIRNTINSLFFTMNIVGVKPNPKISQYSTIHNFFTSVTLRDHKALNTIVKLSRVSQYSNETRNYMILINEILDEDPNANEETKSVSANEYLIRHIYEFLANLERFKGKVGNNIGNQKLDINDAVLKILKDKNAVVGLNVTNAVKKEDGYVLSDNEFWEPEPQTRRIYRGDRTKVKYYPFMASIQMFNSFQCGGSIIKSDLILTASSCLQLAWNNRFYRENPAFLSVRVGSDFYNGGGENIPVLEIYFHPEYNPKSLRNNLCVLRLLRRLKFRKNKRKLKKIEIDRVNSALPMTTDGITILGWGARGSSNIIGNPWSNQLSVAVLNIYHLQECREIYSREYVTETNFCAGFMSKGGGACNRDVGGPGVVSGYLAGVVSFGSPVCGTPDAPTVFTKVGYYADWIDEIMEQDVPHIRKRTTLRPPPLPRFTTPLPHAPPTTFKLDPLTGSKPKPIPIREEETLRILEDVELFKEFLSTMFASQEANDYKDLLNDVAIGKALEFNKENVLNELEYKAENKFQADEEGSFEFEDEKSIQDSVKSSNFITKLNTYESVTEAVIKVTAIDKNLAAEDVKSKIAELIDNISMDDSEGLSVREELSEQISENDEVRINDLAQKKGVNVKKYDGNVRKDNYIQKDDSNVQQDTGNDQKDVGNVQQDNGIDKENDGNVQQDNGNVQKHDSNVQKYVEKMQKKDVQNKEDQVLTLLYISDDEKGPNIENIEEIIEDFDDNFNEGLSISLDGFKDLTFRNNKSESILNVMSKNKLYKLFNEAIDDINKNKAI